MSKEQFYAANKCRRSSNLRLSATDRQDRTNTVLPQFVPTSLGALLKQRRAQVSEYNKFP